MPTTVHYKPNNGFQPRWPQFMLFELTNLNNIIYYPLTFKKRRNGQSDNGPVRTYFPHSNFRIPDTSYETIMFPVRLDRQFFWPAAGLTPDTYKLRGSCPAGIAL
jgi:hypothetical protein